MSYTTSAALNPELEEVLRRLIDAYQPVRVYLFGSHARGDANDDSDYDLLVVVPDTASDAQQRSKLAYQVLWGTRTPADVLVTTARAFDRRAHVAASLPGTARREGILLYDAAA